MFKEILELIGKESMLQQALERSIEMLETDLEMFEEAVRSLRRRDDARIALDIYAQDQRINAFQTEVRRKVFTHLSVASERDLNASLVLVSIVIDIERIGDYTKNIVELALHHPTRLVCGPFEETIARVEPAVTGMFSTLLTAIPNHDAARAREVMSEHWWIARECDRVVNSLIDIDDDIMSTTDAVTTSLYARYLKRVSAHLMNIASSVVNPFDRIGFRGDAYNGGRELADDE
jgi:phosphate uptake regulator